MVKRLLFIFIFIVFIWWFNTFTIKTNHMTIEDSRINDNIVICQISDLHGFQFGKDNKKIIQEISKQNPDIIVATGDMFTFDLISFEPKGKEAALNLLSELVKIAPVYYVSGEHDHDEDFFNQLTINGIHVFNYKEEHITIKNTTLHLYGTNNQYYSDTFDLHNEWSNDDEYFSILLSHLSNFKAFKEFGIDLSLCGDTHGGQVRLPFIGAIYANGNWFADIHGHYTKGLYEEDGKYLYISSGLGSNPIPLRLFNRPEIAVIHLQGKTE